MKKMFKDYLAIFNKFPKTAYLTKAQRKERHQALLDFDKATYHDPIGMDELMAFIALHHHLIMIDNPIFFKKIIPILHHNIQAGGVFALQFLTSTTFGHLFAMYQHCCRELGIKPYGYLQLLDKLLSLEPDNLFAQEQKFDALCERIALSIHEVPWCVLFGNHSANIDETLSLLKSLDDFEVFTKKINKPKPPIIDDARFYYLAWIDYLKSTEDLNFLEHLQKHHDYHMGE